MVKSIFKGFIVEQYCYWLEIEMDWAVWRTSTIFAYIMDTYRCAFAGLAIASALIDISQQKPADCKDKSTGVRNRKHHLSTRQGTCV
ncbi:attractin-like protein 1 [Limosa lapponica baueri]|uniref:Attractin-like protein 1 n=1 Tax=Limosa lapponica baueri TaxID=1758121 RepID=A0A2I0U7C4_LIMLA|nr:attractin-like protein 1 [Limosa lapponica baueri]